jgi:hypothetical protein
MAGFGNLMMSESSAYHAATGRRESCHVLSWVTTAAAAVTVAVAAVQMHLI